jgi:replication fork clamp-binding protein CrfC
MRRTIHSYIGVINRSQEDIINRKSIRDALRGEAEYFATHPMYRSISNRMGTKFLTKTLNRILLQHIRECLPELKQKINKMKADAENEMATYGDSFFENSKNQVQHTHTRTHTHTHTLSLSLAALVASIDTIKLGIFRVLCCFKS